MCSMLIPNGVLSGTTINLVLTLVMFVFRLNGVGEVVWNNAEVVVVSPFACMVVKVGLPSALVPSS